MSRYDERSIAELVLLSFLPGHRAPARPVPARQVARKLTDDKPERTLFLQFHPTLNYDDFIEGFRPHESEQGILYRIDSRLFLSFSETAEKRPTETFVAVIDELNRGDVARVFGEVLTYIEPDYRGIRFTLPFSGREAMLPENLVVIATANPYDRSVTELDDALLRRFWVIDFQPDRALLQSHLIEHRVPKTVVTRTLRVFDILNNRLVHGFGHTTFLAIRDVDDLASVWLGRIQMVLRRSLSYDQSVIRETEAQIESLVGTEEPDNPNVEPIDSVP